MDFSTASGHINFEATCDAKRRTCPNCGEQQPIDDRKVRAW